MGVYLTETELNINSLKDLQSLPLRIQEEILVKKITDFVDELHVIFDYFDQRAQIRIFESLLREYGHFERRNIPEVWSRIDFQTRVKHFVEYYKHYLLSCVVIHCGTSREDEDGNFEYKFLVRNWDAELMSLGRERREDLVRLIQSYGSHRFINSLRNVRGNKIDDQYLKSDFDGSPPLAHNIRDESVVPRISQ